MKSKVTNYSISTKTNIILRPISPCSLNQSCFLGFLNVCLVDRESIKVKVFDTTFQWILKFNTPTPWGPFQGGGLKLHNIHPCIHKNMQKLNILQQQRFSSFAVPSSAKNPILGVCRFSNSNSAKSCLLLECFKKISISIFRII